MILAACGNDCESCPRYNCAPFTKTEEELINTAKLWHKVGYRDRVVAPEEISCTGCKVDNWCRYNVIGCVSQKGLDNCGQCQEYPCDNIKECFQSTKKFIPKCEEVCTKDELAMLRKAFWEKEQNLC